MDGRGALEREARVRFHHLPLFDGEISPEQRRQSDEIGLGDRYFLMLRFAAEPIGRVVETLAAASGPAVFHCAAGKDRTGVISAVILGALDVADEVIVADYAATREGLDAVVERLMQSEGYREMFAALPPDTWLEPDDGEAEAAEPPAAGTLKIRCVRRKCVKGIPRMAAKVSALRRNLTSDPETAVAAFLEELNELEPDQRALGCLRSAQAAIQQQPSPEKIQAVMPLAEEAARLGAADAALLLDLARLFYMPAEAQQQAEATLRRSLELLQGEYDQAQDPLDRIRLDGMKHQAAVALGSLLEQDGRHQELVEILACLWLLRRQLKKYS